MLSVAPFITSTAEVTDALLNVVAHIPTRALATTVEPEFLSGLAGAQLMRVATLPAYKGYAEDGCPIGAVGRHCVRCEFGGTLS